MCIDRYGMRSARAHKGWVTRRARAAVKPLALDPPIEGGLYSRAERERAVIARDAERVEALELAEQLVIEAVQEMEERITEIITLIEEWEWRR